MPSEMATLAIGQQRPPDREPSRGRVVDQSACEKAGLRSEDSASLVLSAARWSAGA